MPDPSVVWLPQLRNGTTVEPSDGAIALRHPLAERSVVLREDLRASLALLDGEHTVEELTVQWCRAYHCAEPDALLELLATLHDAGLLEPVCEAEEPLSVLSRALRIDRVRQALVWRRSSTTLRVLLEDAGGPLANVLARAPVAAFLTLLALVGAVLWALRLRAEPILLLEGATSYLPALLYLLAMNAVFSLVGSIASVAVHRGFGVPVGAAVMGIVAGLPSTWIEPEDDGALSPWRRLWLHMAGPVLGGAIAAALTGLALTEQPAYAEPLLLAATVGWLRLFAATCPFVRSPLTRAITAISALGELRLMALRVLPRRLPQSLADPSDRTRVWAGAWALAMLVWATLGLQLVALLIAPQLPPLVRDLADGPPLLDAILGTILLVLFVTLSVGVLLALGVAASAWLARWIASHPVRGRPGWQLLALLAFALIGLGALAWVSQHTPAVAWPLTIGLAALGALTAFVAGILLLHQHHRGRLAILLMPLPIAALLAALTVALAGTAETGALSMLRAGVSLLITSFLLGWVALVWRSRIGWIGLALAAGLAALAFAGGVGADAARMSLALLSAIAALLMLGSQIGTHLARTWLAVAMAAVIPVSLLLLDPTVALPRVAIEVGYAGVALLIGAALTLWASALWSTEPVPPGRASETAQSRDERLIAILLAGWTAIVGAQACPRLLAAIYAPDDAEADPRGPLRSLLHRLRDDLGEPVARQLIAGGCQALPWEDYLQAIGDPELCGEERLPRAHLPSSGP